jgi:hypothetical protein
MAGYDIIGDIHGHHDKLVELLRRLDYLPDAAGVWRSTTGRRAIFVGDLIDRGPAQAAVIDTVRAMVEQGEALIVMGNHELNALGWALEDPARPGVALRPHTAKNFDQHAAFLALDADVRAAAVEWFATLPLFLELDAAAGGPLRVVHACWDDASVGLLRTVLDDANRFVDAAQIAHALQPHPIDVATGRRLERNELFDAVDTLLKGPEIEVHPYGAKDFKDKGGVTRQRARLRWWRHGDTRFDQLVEIDPAGEDGNGDLYGPLPTATLDGADLDLIYDDDVPVVFGHHWRAWGPERHVDFTDVTACVDFSAAKEGPLVAYRFDGPGPIDPGRYLTADGPAVVGGAEDS